MSGKPRPIETYRVRFRKNGEEQSVDVKARSHDHAEEIAALRVSDFTPITIIPPVRRLNNRRAKP
jgi:hypothetical protein